MKKEAFYESPEFKFEEIELSERIADTCWGFHYGWYDIDHDGKVDSNEKIDLSSMGSCESVEIVLADYLNTYYNAGLYIKKNGKCDDTKTNTHSTVVRPINS